VWMLDLVIYVTQVMTSGLDKVIEIAEQLLRAPKSPGGCQAGKTIQAAVLPTFVTRHLLTESASYQTP